MNKDALEQKFRELQMLHTIAVQLNGAIELQHALKLTLQHTVDLMQLHTGWIWLLHPSTNSVFLAASHELPPAFTQHPERLSGWCYCIEKYLENDLESAANISEITCSRLKDLEEGTAGLRYHASVPLYDGDQKIGLLNIVSEASGQFTKGQLHLLHTIGEMLSVTIARARLFEKSKDLGVKAERDRISKQVEISVLDAIEKLSLKLNRYEIEPRPSLAHDQIVELKRLTDQIQSFTQQSISELKISSETTSEEKKLQYPTTPLSNRELEVLELLKQGKTNKAIAAELFIAERTVKFHVSAILEKLQADNRTDAVRIAINRGIVNW